MINDNILILSNNYTINYTIIHNISYHLYEPKKLHKYILIAKLIN